MPPPSAPLPVLPNFTATTPTPVGAVLPAVGGTIPTATGNQITFFDTGGGLYFLCYTDLPEGTLFSAGANGLPRVWKVLESEPYVLGYTVPLTVYKLRLVDASNPDFLGAGDYPITPGVVRPVPLPTVSAYEFIYLKPTAVGSVLGAAAAAPSAPLPVLANAATTTPSAPLPVMPNATTTTPTPTGSLL